VDVPFPQIGKNKRK